MFDLLREIRSLEVGLFTTCLDQVLFNDGTPLILMSPEMVGDGDIEITRAQNRNWLLGEGFRRCVQQANTWPLFLRYQAQAERNYRRAVEEFERLKALRPELPNEPICDLSPNQTQPLIPSENELIPAGCPGVESQEGGPPIQPCTDHTQTNARHFIMGAW